MISMSRAINTVLENVKPISAVEVKLGSVFGMVLAEDVVSDIDMPPFNKSAMDGYAVVSSAVKKTPITLRVTASIAAGVVYKGSSFKEESFENNGADGDCVKIMTGAPVPEGMDAVVMLEDTECRPDGKVKLFKKIEAGQNICVRGEDVRKGEIVLRKGTRILGPEIAILATAGKDSVSVFKKPAVGIVSTGNEIVEPEASLEEGKIRNSNGPMLAGLAEAIGCDVEYFGIAGDEEKILRKLILKGLKKDVMLLSGGVSMGDYDLVPEMLKKEGAELLFHGVLVKPGKPLLYAKKDGCSIFGIPGNPVSNFTSFNVFIKPAIYKMMGREDCNARFIDAFIEVDFINRSSRVHIIPSICSIVDGRCLVSPFRLNGSADINGCSRSNCFLIIDASVTGIKKGDRVKVLPMDA